MQKSIEKKQNQLTMNSFMCVYCSFPHYTTVSITKFAFAYLGIRRQIATTISALIASLQNLLDRFQLEIPLQLVGLRRMALKALAFEERADGLLEQFSGLVAAGCTNQGAANREQ